MPLFASGIKLAEPLKKGFEGIGDRAQGGLADALGRLRTQARTSGVASGRPVGEYQDFALDQAGKQASRGIDDALLGALGGASYDDFRKQQEFDRQMALAKEIGGKNKPSLAEEILGGLSQGVNLATKGKGIYDSLGKSGGQRNSNPSLDLYTPGSTGASRYGIDPSELERLWGGY